MPFCLCCFPIYQISLAESQAGMRSDKVAVQQQALLNLVTLVLGRCALWFVSVLQFLDALIINYGILWISFWRMDGI